MDGLTFLPIINWNAEVTRLTAWSGQTGKRLSATGKLLHDQFFNLNSICCNYFHKTNSFGE